MDAATNISCPVCTLYLRPGITLKTHLSSHPKQKVIEALVRLAETEDVPKTESDPSQNEPCTSSAVSPVVNSQWNQSNVNGSQMQGNHLFIYQQSMSSTQPPQQYVIPTVLNPQMMPYIYQQQVIMRSMPFELPSTPASIENGPNITEHVEEEAVAHSPKKQEKSEIITEDCEIQQHMNNSLDMQVYEIDDDEEEDAGEKDKACQTQAPLVTEEPIEEEVEPEKETNFYYMNGQTFDQANPIYTAANILQSNDHLDFGDMMVINDIHEFSTNQIISQVENFEGCAPDKPGVLMTIGGMIDNSKDGFFDPEQRDADESMSRESSNVNIRADERMPPKGELSGQESLGGSSDITWHKVQYDGNSGMSTSYDLLGRENWEPSDSSDVDIPPLQSRIPPHITYPENDDNDDNDMPTVVSFTGPPLNFKCPLCEEAFACLKDRQEHERDKHPEKARKKLNRIGTEINKKKVKKLVIKARVSREESKHNFDNVFTNKLKIEPEPDLENTELPKLDDATVKTDESLPNIQTFCPLCGCVVLNAKELKEHKLNVHNISSQNRHKCATCDEVFPNDYKFTEHLRIHPLECKICGRLFYRRQNIQLHMRRHLGIKPYKCDVCEKSFLTKQKLLEHRNIHTGETPIKCSLCDETFRRYSNLVQHRNRHHLNIKRKVKDYICFCKEIFHSKRKLAWHKEIHDAKPKSCAHCNEKFIHMSSLTRHMRRAHNDKFLPNGHKKENAECPICKGIFLKSSLEVHIRNHSGQRPFTCLICNKDFTTKWNLKLHKWTHASRVSKPFKCDQCKGAFIRESDYTAHMNSHKSIRPYTCNHCGAQFIRKYNCQRHVKEHENQKMFNCTVCGKTFHRSYYLKDHMRIHSGHRPYSCHICGKTSATKSNHNKHVQIHHAREPVSTEN